MRYFCSAFLDSKVGYSIGRLRAALKEACDPRRWRVAGPESVGAAAGEVIAAVELGSGIVRLDRVENEVGVAEMEV